MDSVIDDGQRVRSHGHAISGREQELQKLLAEERLRSEQRKTNYSTLKSEHVKLQKDFLSLQSDMRQILEETKIIKDKKDGELNSALKLVDDKDKIIDKLCTELKERDPLLIKDRFTEELQEPIRRLQREKENLVREKEKMGFEIKMAKQKIEYLEKESVDSVERVKLAYDAEINLVRKEREEMRTKLLEANQTPDAQRMLNLTQENAKLTSKLKGYQSTIDDTKQQYQKIQNKVELLLIEQEKSEKAFENQIDSFNLQLSHLRDENRNMRDDVICGKREINDLLAEIKRLKTENNRLKNEYEEREKQFLDEKEKLKMNSSKGQKEIESERDTLCDELKKLKIETENRNEHYHRMEQESVNKNKEFQLQIATVRQQEWEKRCQIEQEKVNVQSKLKDEREEKLKLKDEIDQLKRQIENGSELRMGIERDLLILRAKVESYQTNIEELEKLRRQHISLHDELNKLRSESAETSALNRELVRQRERYKDDYNRIKEDLDNERKQIAEFKVQSDKNLTRLKQCIDDERSEMREKLLNIERDAIRWKREKDETKSKYKQYAAIAEKLQNKLSDMKEQQHQSHQKVASGATVPIEVHHQLKKQFKTLKRKQNELSNLLNSSFDATQCKELNQQQ